MEIVYRQITLIIVESCNLNCTYCYEKHKENSSMSFETAKTIIDREIQESSPDMFFQIEFFGGEPFLNFPLMKEVVAYVKEKYPERVSFNTTTNGVLLNDEMKQWLMDHKDNFFAAVSVDGTEYAHNLNRMLRNSIEGSYKKIDLDFFLNTYESAKVKMTIAPNTVEYMADGIIELTEKGFEVDATLAMGDIDWSDEKNVGVLLEQLNRMVEYYKNNPQYPVVRMLKVPIESMFNNKEKQTTRYCGAGARIHCYTGNELEWTPCQGFSRITLGEDSKLYYNETFEDYVEPDGICKQCKINSVCIRCWGTNLAATGSIDDIDPWVCVINRILIVAGAKIAYDRIINKEEITDSDQRILKGINIIIEEAFNKNNQYLKECDKL